MTKKSDDSIGPFVILFAQVSLVGFVRVVAETHDSRANMIAVWMLIVFVCGIDAIGTGTTDFLKAFKGINSLSSGILLPLLFDEVHSMHDSDYYLVRAFFNTGYVPFLVIAALVVSSLVREGKGFMARISVAVITIASALFFFKPPPMNNTSMALLTTYFGKSVVMGTRLRERWSLSLFETSLLMSLTGYAVSYAQILGDIPKGGDIFSQHNSMHFFVLAALIMIDLGALVTVTSDMVGQKEGGKKQSVDFGTLIRSTVAAVLLLIDIPVLLTLLPMPIPDALQWLVAFIHADDSAHLKTSGSWIVLIMAVQWLADHVTQPKLTIVEVPQERMDAEGKTQTKMVDVTYADFEKTKMRQISARKLFHFLLVGILVPIIVRGGSHVHSFCALSLGGMLVVFIALEMLRSLGYLWPQKTRPKWLLGLTCYFDRFTGKKKRWGNEITIMGRSYDPAVDEVQRLTVAAQKSWSLTKDHFSLLLGCGIPVWFHASIGSGGMESSVLPLMGCICVGLGDALSAIVGSNYGRIKWSPSESNRTVEGSVAGFLASLVMAGVVMYTSSEGLSNKKLLAAAITMAGATVLEAFAEDNDNLLLAMYPTVLYTALLLWLQ